MKHCKLFFAFLFVIGIGTALAEVTQLRQASEACWLWVRELGMQDLDFKFHSDASIECFLRTKLVIDEPVKHAWFYTCYDKQATMYLNGELLTFTPCPQFAKLRGHVKAKGVDIASRLESGENILAIAASTSSNRSCYGVIIRGEIEFESGRRQPIVTTSKAFRASSKCSDGWMKAGYDDSEWLPALEIGDVRLSPWILCGDMFTQFATLEEIRLSRLYRRVLCS